MPETGDISWERTALVFGALAALIGIIAKVWRFPLQWLSREAIKGVLARELQTLKRLQRDMGALEDRIVTLEQMGDRFSAMLAADRSETRGDLAVHAARIDNSLREVRKELHGVAEKLHLTQERVHTLVGIVQGPSALRRGQADQR